LHLTRHRWCTNTFRFSGHCW